MKKETIDILNASFYDWVGKNLYRGGAERYVIDLARLIDGLGYGVRIIQNANFYFEKKYSGFKVVGIPAKAGWDFGKLSEYYVNHFAHSGYTICSPLNIACKFSIKNRSIGINHGIYWDYIQNKLTLHTDDRHKYLFDALKKVEAGVCVDTNFINWVRTYDYELSEKLVYIPNYYDPQQFKYVEKDFSDEEIIILYPRRLCLERGFYLTLKLVDYILSNHENIKFHFVGQIYDSEMDSKKSYLDKYPQKIEFYTLDMHEMHKAYSNSQIVLVPTVNAEGTSLSCIEAMATNNAIVATNIGGLPNLIIDGFNGLLINPREEELIKAVEFLIKNRSARIKLARNASESVKAFRKEIWEKRWKELLTDFINQTGRFSLAAEKSAIADQVNQATPERGTLSSRLNETMVEKGALESQLKQTMAERDALSSRLNEIMVEKGALESQLKQTMAERNALNSQLNQTQEVLNGIYASNCWKVARTYYRVRDGFFLFRYPYNFLQTWRREGFKRALEKTRSKIGQITGGIFEHPRKFVRTWRSKGFKCALAKTKNKVDNTLGIFSFISSKVDRHKLKKILDRCSPNHKGIIIYAPVVDWNLPLFQRPQHLAQQMAGLGYLYFYCTPHCYDNIQGFHQQEENLYITRRYDLLLENIADAWIILHAAAPGFTVEDIKEYKAKGLKIIYDYVDEIHPHVQGSDRTEDILKRHLDLDSSHIDLVLAVSRRLYEEMTKRFPPQKVILHPNGVEYEHFHRKRSIQDCPEDMKDIVEQGKPIIGYYGALARWIDYELLNYLSVNRPEWNLVLIGWDFDGSMKALSENKNIRYLGIKQYQELPRYGIFFDVAIIPFKEGDIAKATSPIKLYEYMAMNKPVVVTNDMVECKSYEGVFGGADKDDFIKKIEEALRLKDEPSYLSLLDRQARENTWQARALEIDNYIKHEVYKVE